MLTLLQSFSQLVAYALIQVVNLLIFAIGGLLQLLFLALPSMPAPPTQPVTDWIGWLNWAFPIAGLVACFSAAVLLWVAYLAIRVPLRWVKAL